MPRNTAKYRGFTLVELLVVISIISLLSSVVLTSLNSAREKAKIAATLGQIHNMKNLIAIYESTYGAKPLRDCVFDYPPHNNPSGVPPPVYLTCDATTDPFLNASGIAFSVWNYAHPWGGHISYFEGNNLGSDDYTCDGKKDYTILLNDDRPGQGSGDNGGRIPTNVLQKIDKILDDDNLATGDVRGDNNDFDCPVGGSIEKSCATGELCIRLRE